MIRFANLVLIVVSVFFLVSCSNNGSKKAGSQKDSTGNKDKTETAKNDVDLSVVATDACDCISDFENGLSDEAKEMVVEASKNGGLDTITRVFSDKDRKVWSSEGSKARNCLKQLEKKYPAIKKSSGDYKKALEEHCSEFAAAWAE